MANYFKEWNWGEAPEKALTKVSENAANVLLEQITEDWAGGEGISINFGNMEASFFLFDEGPIFKFNLAEAITFEIEHAYGEEKALKALAAHLRALADKAEAAID